MTLALTKYVGSKASLLDVIRERLPVPQSGGAVALPFLGGGSVAADYAARGCRVIASDINPRLVYAHVWTRDAVDDVIEGLTDIVTAWRAVVEPLDGSERDAAGRSFYEEVRGMLATGDSSLGAARLLFVIRAGFNGLYRENTAGECTTAYGKPEPTRDLVQADALRAYSQAVRDVEFLCEDFAITLARCRPGWAAYCDPPYQSTFDGYAGGDWDARQPGLPGMGRVSDRERLAAMLRYLTAIGVRWTVSDADHLVPRQLYQPATIDLVSRKGTVNSNGEGRDDVAEILARNWR